ncbi:hypothetical protein BABINDRAFT_159483 [Babjeviella inositovora NRRL Y-12698]|uniref:Uncharacterized protein n=1 Tax=Babjeviella inositovora NRRL Y-12698 TaxID=984486 RepID=A0A1E3QZF5_9ASCO|nr:uncharacterized protein BABINDRAFT_159483 [Babjeviella inositovora NRRL Y-12698]ODQ83005.1 hypothetical protein BABINDRAFT_159483 [Babjeviella inositovora NRRL Y-12698]
MAHDHTQRQSGMPEVKQNKVVHQANSGISTSFGCAYLAHGIRSRFTLKYKYFCLFFGC